MAFKRDIPAASDFLSDSQADIRDNFNSSDDVFTIDHYAFSNTTANKGFHNRVTQPQIIGGVHPTTSTDAIIYTMQDCAGIGNIQYSKGPNFNGISPTPSTYQPPATPLTNVYSPRTPMTMAHNVTRDILDFSGLGSAVGRLVIYNLGVSPQIGTIDFVYNSVGNLFNFITRNSNSSNTDVIFKAASTTSILQVQNTASAVIDVFWVLNFMRINA